MADSPVPFPGQASPSNGGMALLWNEPFNYTNGALTGQGGWTHVGGGATAIVATSDHVTTGTLVDGSNSQTTALAALNPAAAFAWEFDIQVTGAQLVSEYVEVAIQGATQFTSAIINTGSDFEPSGQATVSIENDLGFEDSPNVVCARNAVHTVRVEVSASQVITMKLDGVAILNPSTMALRTDGTTAHIEIVCTVHGGDTVQLLATRWYQ